MFGVGAGMVFLKILAEPMPEKGHGQIESMDEV